MFSNELESEAIYILREVKGQFENPVILFSGGKDSLVVTHLCKKAFYPAKIPFPLLHVDTDHNFPETIKFRDKLTKQLGVRLIISSVQSAINKGLVIEEKGVYASRNLLQIKTLFNTIKELNIDCAIGGARRDEEKSRAKERFFSHRDHLGQWNPKNQRPELWKQFNGLHQPGEHFRVFPINNWTEKDVWRYIKKEQIEVPSLYFAHRREVIKRNNTWIPNSSYIQLEDHEKIENKHIRFRTLGDITITGGIESKADTVDKIIEEISEINQTERGNREDDKRSFTAMEDRKKNGYF